MEKVDEHGLLFDVEGGADPQRPVVGASGVDRDELDGFRGLKRPSSTLGLGQLAAESVEVDDEGLGFHESLGVFDALDVTVVCMLVCGLDSDDVVGPGILSLRYV